tara:strand:+ start:1218 stop:2057 length:840 start_codon:yes stop_codon:yes gene_type:complete
MKITRREIRKLVREEAKRELPISYYSDDMLIEEGLMDLLKGLFGNLVKFFSDAYEDAEKKVGTQWKSANNRVQDLATKLLGKEEAAEVQDLEDLEVNEKEEHFKIYVAATAPVVENVLNEVLEGLKKSGGVKDWTPADDSDEAVKKWEDENGDASLGLWEAFGLANGVVKFFADQDLPEASGIAGKFESAADSGNPGQAVQHLVRCINYIGKTYGGNAAAGVKAAAVVVPVAEKALAAAKAIGGAIEASGKEQQKESLELRKLINHMIIEERKIIKENK